MCFILVRVNPTLYRAIFTSGKNNHLQVSAMPHAGHSELCDVSYYLKSNVFLQTMSIGSLTQQVPITFTCPDDPVTPLTPVTAARQPSRRRLPPTPKGVSHSATTSPTLPLPHGPVPRRRSEGPLLVRSASKDRRSTIANDDDDIF